MKTFEDIRKQTLNRINRARRILRILQSSSFEDAWLTLSLEESKKIEGFIVLNQATLLEKWLQSHQKPSFDEMTVRELREEAKRYGIPYYGTLTKSSLLWELHNADATRNEKRNASFGPVVENEGSRLQFPSGTS